ncbi:MAG: hypothetical protein HFI93_06170 [Lachnospiraceae bacterium]|nr:hypothetical protein [Lachnospiraceae bacterium]
MRKLFCLTRVLFKTSLGSLYQGMAGNKNKKKNGKGWGGKLLCLFLLICLFPTFIMLGVAAYEGHDLLAGIGQEGLIVSFIGILGSMATLIFAISLVLSIFYMSRDVEMLLPMPLKPWEIVGAKFTVAWLYEAATTALLVLPPFIGYGLAEKSGILYGFFVALSVLFLPAAPLVYAGLVLMLIMRIFKGVKNKDFLNLIAMVIVLAAAMALGFSMQSMEGISQAELVTLLSAGENSLLGLVKSLFPHLGFLEKALLEGDALSMFLFVAASFGFIAVFLAAANFLYFGGVAGMNETSAKRRKISEKESLSINRRTGAVASYAGKERKILFRTPIYFVNCALLAFIWPLLFLIPLVMGLSSQVEIGELTWLVSEAKEWISSMSGQDRMSVLAAALFAAYGLSCMSLSLTAASGTSISREGTNFSYMKYIPLSYRDQIRGKLLCGIEICAVGSSGYTGILLVLAVAFLGVPAAALPLGLILSVLINVLFNCLQLLVDLWRPKLVWETETQAVKQNLNVVVEMFGSMGLSVLFGFLGWKLFGIMTDAGLSAWAPIGIMTGVLALTAFVLYRVTLKVGERMLERLE